MKKLLLVSFLAFILLLASGCGKKPMMDEVNQQGFYPYSNETLNFSLSLPKEFEYYQTERTTNDISTDLHFFVPTADISAPKKVSGYAEPITVRVFKKEAFETLNESEKKALAVVGEKKGNVYVLKFWDEIPSDWKDKWTDAMKQQIVSNFKLK
jgi:hypothetical protein